MATKVFFNRPLRPIDLNPLWHDIKNTRKHLVIASAWFTDKETASSFIDSNAEIKTVIFNAADIQRGSRGAYELIKSYFNNPVIWDGEIDENALYTSPNSKSYGMDVMGSCAESAKYRFIVLGSGNWQEGVMHHKFILCDDFAWIGSFNFTYQARKNYENLLRLDEKAIVKQLYDEVDFLIEEPNIRYSNTPVNDIYICQICGKMHHISFYGNYINDGYGSDIYICKRCWSTRVSDIRNRYGDDAASDVLDKNPNSRLE